MKIQALYSNQTSYTQSQAYISGSKAHLFLQFIQFFLMFSKNMLPDKFWPFELLAA